MADKSAWELEGIEHSKSMERVKRELTMRDWLSTVHYSNWPVYLIVAVCCIIFVAQIVVPLPVENWGFSGKALDEGRYATLITSLFMHGGIPHIWLNMSAFASLAPLVCARFGKGVASLIPFTAFFILCGVAGNLLFWALHPHGDIPAVGASGAIYGVAAAMFRLDLVEDRLRGMFSREVLRGWWWMIASNVVIIGLFGGPAILVSVLSGEFDNLVVPIAWEAHVGGFIAGLFLIGIMAGKGWRGDWRGGISLRNYLRDIEDAKAEKAGFASDS